MRTTHAVISFALALPLGAALACPVCNSATGQDVRRGVFAEGLGRNALAAGTPFALCGVVALAVNGRGTARIGRRTDAEEPDRSVP